MKAPAVRHISNKNWRIGGYLIGKRKYWRTGKEMKQTRGEMLRLSFTEGFCVLVSGMKSVIV